MIINSRMPPRVTGETEIDLKKLNDWCCTFLNKLKNVLSNIDDSNIKSVSADKITGGNIDFSTASLSGDNVNIGSDYIRFILNQDDGQKICLELSVKDNVLYFILSTPDDKYSIKIEHGSLDINANNIYAESITAKAINADNVYSGALNCTNITCDIIQAREYINRG